MKKILYAIKRRPENITVLEKEDWNDDDWQTDYVVEWKQENWNGRLVFTVFPGEYGDQEKALAAAKKRYLKPHY